MKILVAGVGRVGSQTAWQCIHGLKPSELMLYDIKDLSGDMLDLRHACSGMGIDTKITDKIEPADYIVVTAGKPRTPDNLDEVALYQDNLVTVQAVISELKNKHAFKESTTLVIMTNPVLRLTKAISDALPSHRVVCPESILLNMRGGEELGAKILQSGKGYTSFGPAVSCMLLIKELEMKR